ncbi:MAG: single-stranded DNA-binding protein [Candidatus Omnitrophica bacterium]|nr:single-stranded DNA-binding protein [Candidatus Omnitrophota bacterium]
MTGSFNKVILIGNLGQDPEIKTLNNDKEFATLSLATSENWTDKMTGQKKDKTDWHRVVVFAEALVKIIKNYAKKGTKLCIEGQLQTRKWVDDKDQERFATEVVLNNFKSSLVLLGAKPDGGIVVASDDKILHDSSDLPF